MKSSWLFTRKFTSVALVFIIIAFVAGLSFASDRDAGKDSNTLSRKDEVLITVTGKVKNIDHQKREISLEDQEGKMILMTVDASIKRLNEVKVGDIVSTDYYMSIAAELRPPTAAEVEKPFVVVEGQDRSPSGSLPSGIKGRTIKAVCTIEALDRPAESVTLKGPQGNFLVVRVLDPSRLTQGRIGDTVVVTYTEALAIRLDRKK
jgi:hypothetical protein